MNHDSPLRLVVLGSGSSGNAAAITDGTTTVLVDCGFSAREVARRMTCAGLDPASVSAIFITHEHTDHTRGVDVFVRRHATDCTVYATAGTISAAGLGILGSRVERVVCGEPGRCGTLEVLPFRTSHDAAEPMGVRVESPYGSVGIATDTGVLTPEAFEALGGVSVLGIESNHDVRMLEIGPYPPFLKRRIRSSAGHLSNADAADALERLASDELVRVFALHRSRTNNTAALAAQVLGERAERVGLSVKIEVAAQSTPCDSHPPQSTLFG